MKKSFQLLFMTLFLVTVLTGCSVASESPLSVNNRYSAAEGVSVENKAMTADSAGESFNYDSGSGSEADIVKSTMMIVRNADVSVDVGNLEEFNENLKSNVEKFSGYFERSTIQNYDSEWSSERYAYFTIRIPEENLDAFLNVVDGETSVISKTISNEDISLEYVDTEARIKALEEEKENLLKLMDKAESTSEIIEIEGKLTDVQYELDSKNNQKRTLEGRVNYSTVNMDATERRNVGDPMKEIFEVNIKEKAIEGLKQTVEVSVGILTTLPVVIIVTVFIALVLLLFTTVFKKIWNRIFKKKDGIQYVLMPVKIENPEDQFVIKKQRSL